MELIYLWVDRYKNIVDQEFNFSPQFNFTFDRVREKLIFNPKEDPQPEAFFHPGISNITAIIGKNGAGKSNLLDLLRVVLTDTIGMHLRLILVFRKNNGEFTIHFPADEMDIENMPERFVTELHHAGIFNSYQKLRENEPVDFLPVFLSPIVDFRYDEISEEKEINLSADHLLEIDAQKLGSQTENLREILKYQQVGRQIDFINSPNQFEMPFPLPTHVQILIRRPDPVIGKPLKNKEESLLGYFYNTWLEIDKKLEEESKQASDRDFDTAPYLLERLRNNMTWSVLAIALGHSEKFSRETLSYFTKEYQEGTLLFKAKAFLRDYYSIFDQDVSQVSKVSLHFLEESIRLIGNSHWMDYVNEWSFIITASEFSGLREAYINFIRFFHEAHCMDFNWVVMHTTNSLFEDGISIHNLSSGELRFIDLFSKFHYAKMLLDARQNNEVNFITILIDEGETGFHPQWQKEYINVLTKQLPLIFNGYQLQIILTTHSPIIASDLPRDNIIFLDRDEDGKCLSVSAEREEETFGANIHSLYTDSFFIQNGLMGEFAKEKINKTIQWIKETGKESNAAPEIKYILRHIGEPVIRKKLTQLYESRQHDLDR